VTAYVPLEIDQGEDFFGQVVWTDELNSPMNVISPCQLDIRNAAGTLILSLAVGTGLAVSNSTGIIQISLTKAQTIALAPGDYAYDLFATISATTGNKVDRIIAGPVNVNKRITQMA
jgi:hypothetical protein